MKHLKTGLVLAIAVVFASAPSYAQLKIGGHIGIDLDASELYLGPHVIFDLPVEVGSDDYLMLNPEVSFYLGDSDVPGVSSSRWLFAATALYPLGFETVSAYFGAGLVFSRSTYSVDSEVDLEDVSQTDSSNDFGLNLKAGAEFGLGNATPFAEAGLVISDGNWVYLQGGARFQFGR
jgi:hypothetical protein